MYPLASLPLIDTPVGDPILIFAIAMVVFLTAPLILERYKLPGIVGIILVGAAIGPNGIHLLERDITFILLGEVGLVYLMFVAGLEINLNQFIEYKDRSLVFGLLSFVIPQAVGTAVGIYVLDLDFLAASLFAAIFSSHTLLAYPIVNRLGIANNEAMTATIGGTIITDTLALLVLAVAVAAYGGVLDAAFWVQLGIGLAVFFVGVWLIVPRLGRWFFGTVDSESYFEFLFVMTILFVCAFLAEVIGVKHIIGAFLAGLALNRLIPESGPLMNRIEFIGNALLIPFFLLSVGMLVNVWALREGPDTILIATSLIAFVLITKFLAAWTTGRLYRFDSAEVMGMFGLSVGQAAAALAIVLIGFDENIPGFDQHMINGVVLMILVVSIVSPALVEWAGLALRKAEERGEYDPGEAAQRILIPMAPDSPNRETLLDVALMLRHPRSEDPLYVLSVVPPGADAEASLASSEEDLRGAEKYVAGAEVSTTTLTRVDQNVAAGIVRTIIDNRITTLVIGWDGARSRRQTVFGSTIDRILRRTDQLIFVSRTTNPVNTTERVVVLLPPRIDHSTGFFEAVHHIKVMADEVGCQITCLAVDGNAERFEQLFDLVDPEVPVTCATIPGWKALLASLRDDLLPTDFVVCLSSRRGRVGWHEELQTLPKSISTLFDGNFVVVYPATERRGDDRQFLRFT